MDWVDEDDDEDEDGGDENSGKPAAAETNPATDSRPVRLLDYACGTGLISRVSLLASTYVESQHRAGNSVCWRVCVQRSRPRSQPVSPTTNTTRGRGTRHHLVHLTDKHGIAQALAQFTTHCVGIDISGNMVAAYNARAENQVSQSFLPLFAPLPFTHRRNPSCKYTRVFRTWLSFLFSQW